MIATPPNLASLAKTKWAWIIATFFGSGFLRPGSGTWASVFAAAIWFAGGRMAGIAPARLGAVGLSISTGIAVLIVLGIGIPASTIVARESGWKDPGFVVIDEVAGQWTALIAAPADWRFVLLSLIFFRAFDIRKPFPVSTLERLPRGWGIMLDDIGAGLYALLLLQLTWRWVVR